MHAWPIKSRHYGYWFFLWLKRALLVQTNCQFGNLINCSLCITRWTSESWTVYLWLWAWSKSLWSFLLMQYVWCVIRHTGIISSSFKGNIYFCIFPLIYEELWCQIYMWSGKFWGEGLQWNDMSSLSMSINGHSLQVQNTHMHRRTPQSWGRRELHCHTAVQLKYLFLISGFHLGLHWPQLSTEARLLLTEGCFLLLESEELYSSIQLRWWVHSQNWVCGDDGLLMLTC